MKVGIVGLLSGAGAWAQCAMCRTADGALGAGGAKTIDTAVLIMLVPAVALFCGVFLTVFRNRGGEE